MKKRAFLVAAVVALCVGFAAQASVAATRAVCPTAGQITAGGPITIVDGVASVPVTIAAGCTDVQVSLVSYTAPGASFDEATAAKQSLFDTDVRSLSAGTYTLHVKAPSCYFQVDLVAGAPIEHLGPSGTTNFYGAQGRLLQSLNGGTEACVPPPSCPTSGMVLANGPITTTGGVATVEFTVAAGCKDIELSLVSYKAPSGQFDAATASQQVLFDSKTGLFSAGVYSLTVNLPSCFYQADFVFGKPIEHLGPAGSNNFYGTQGRLIEASNGGTAACEETTAPVVTEQTTAPAGGETSQTVAAPAEVVTAAAVVASTPTTTAAPTQAGNVLGATKTITKKSTKAKKVAKAKPKKAVAKPKKVHKHAKPAKAVVSGAHFTG